MTDIFSGNVGDGGDRLVCTFLVVNVGMTRGGGVLNARATELSTVSVRRRYALSLDLRWKGGFDMTSNSLFLSAFQVDFSWVADEPLGEESDFCDEAIIAYAMVETISREDPPNWYCCAPKEEDRICHHFPGKQFTMYEFAFREAGIRLPFNSFQMSVFKWLRLAPSQLHPNALAFMRAFELVCQFLGIGCTRALFFHVFHLQRSGSRGRHSWVSFKQPVRLFKTYEDSVRHFKTGGTW
ncbi:hypothetical protein KIW84_076288 [Lathyrus oleraceus]|uniref:Transposase (putative) gypsy type domain-containing protein n=1 Tax=Pisum sativum TaxID=3888 RepID=A0A9D4VXP0_PEA|nr:hypothetical protein KIW84_076288 [Pisum sativum]